MLLLSECRLSGKVRLFVNKASDFESDSFIYLVICGVFVCTANYKEKKPLSKHNRHFKKAHFKYFKNTY